MSTSDQAFIRAYSRDDAEQAPPSPHWSYPGGGARSGRTDLSSQPSAANPYLVEDLPLPDVQLPDAQLPTADTAIRSSVPRKSLLDGPVTSYVPPSHVPLTNDPAAGVDGTSESRSSADNRDRIKQGRQPLSAFSSTTRSTMRSGEPDDFTPALAVERFMWPAECDALLERTADAFDLLIDQLMLQAKQGRHIIALTGCQRGDGRKTVMLTLARELSRRGMKVAMVDADFHSADLAARLGIAVQVGWEDVLGRGLPLAETVVVADRSGAMLLPLKDIVSEPASMCESELTSVSLSALRRHSDFVFVDVGPLLDDRVAASALVFAVRSGLEAALVVQNSRRSSVEDVAEVTSRLGIVGVPVVGIIENFSVRQSADSLSGAPQASLSV